MVGGGGLHTQIPLEDKRCRLHNLEGSLHNVRDTMELCSRGIWTIPKTDLATEIKYSSNSRLILVTNSVDDILAGYFSVSNLNASYKVHGKTKGLLV